MYERFSDNAKNVVSFALEEAKEQGQDYVGAEHLLLGLLREREGIGALVLNVSGVTLDEARGKVAEISAEEGEKPKEDPKNIPFTPHAKFALELTLREALSLGHNYIGTEHLLLAVIREAKPTDKPREESYASKSGEAERRLFPDDKRSVVGEVLKSFDVDLGATYDMVKKVLGERGAVARLREQRSALEAANGAE